MLIKIFKYLENLWTGKDGRPSKRSVLAIIFSINFLQNITYAVHKWDANKSLDGLALTLSVEAGLIMALLGLKAWENVNSLRRNRFDNQPFNGFDDGKGQMEEVK